MIEYDSYEIDIKKNKVIFYDKDKKKKVNIHEIITTYAEL